MPTIRANTRCRRPKYVATVAVALALLVGIVVFLTDPGEAHACSCLPPGLPLEELEASDAVFFGRVTSIRTFDGQLDPDTPISSYMYFRTVSFDVRTVWKGDVPEQMEVVTSFSDVSCGYSFDEGGEYLVYAWEWANAVDVYSTGFCGRTASWSNAQGDLNALGEGRAPQTNDTDTSFPWAVVLAVATGIVLVFGVLVYSRLRGR